MIGSGGQPIAARSGHILDKCVNRHLFFVGKPADTRRDQRRLHGRSTGRIQHQSHGLGLALAKGTLNGRRHSLITERQTSPGADRAGQPYDRNKRVFVKER